MGAGTEAEIDAWLRQGKLVVAASERAARALTAAFHRSRRAEGLKAWNTPNVKDWKSFVRGAWAERVREPRLVLNAAQEQALWARQASDDDAQQALLEGPRFRLAALAMEAHELLCTHAPRWLRAATRAGWQNDAAAFGRWLSGFEQKCRASSVVGQARLSLELLELLEDASGEDAAMRREPLLLAGFDRILPVQRTLLDAWGNWSMAESGAPAGQIEFHQAATEQEELDACALWCSRKFAAQPDARLLIVSQDAAGQRGKVERALLKLTGWARPQFEFSLGVPLGQVALPRAAHLLLRWLDGRLAEHEIDWLISTGYAANAAETQSLQAHMRALRRRGLEQPHWTLAAFAHSAPGGPKAAAPNAPLEAWFKRMLDGNRRMDEASRRAQTSMHWAETANKLLETLGFAASGAQSSAEFQSAQRWQQAVETAGSLGFDGSRIEWREFLSSLARTLEQTLFAAESHDAPILIAGPAESAGLTADGVWFLGATEDAWPGRGTTHPLLPAEIQREAGMPHATPQLDWELARTITARLLAAAPEVHFSYARQSKDAEARPSRLVALLAAVPQPLPANLLAEPARPTRTVMVEDSEAIPFPHGKVQGGAKALTLQSQCPFKAFATLRLGADDWAPAQPALTAAQRGQLLHAVLHAVWAGKPAGMRTYDELVALADKRVWVADHVERTMQTALPRAIRERMPARYLELEQQRLVRLVGLWLDYESTRVRFEVLKTEANCTTTVAGLTLDLRIDRLDRLSNGSVLVIDYKTGNVTPALWEHPRPDDVQLPLYAGFALGEEHAQGLDIGGLAFAKVHPSKREFAGHVADAAATLDTSLTGRHSLVTKPFTLEMLMAWRKKIEELARDFLAGCADVYPRDPTKTCDRCGLQTLCRIQENQPADLDEDDQESGFAIAEAADD